ncbi:MAG: UvrB/UvrC motif-containing protein [candidate division WOR-3 bacterium]|nr:MAG: UvrB/UvrC motif-containing protein [candidate division WOR-3 bacterium]
MLCDDCRNKPASIFFKEVLPDKTVELHLCDECASKRGLLVTKKLSPQEILQKLLRQKSAQDEKIICPNCYMSLAEFKRVGRFGCNQCITTFDDHIKHLIKQIHQSDRHIGRKSSSGTKKGFEIYKLREDLKNALDSEAYEDAAKIRDKLKDYGIEDA